jgi:hypothetical protein
MPMTLTVRKIAHAAIDAMSEDDMAAIVYLWQGQPQNFTKDRQRLRRTIDQPYMPFTDPPPAFCLCNVCRLDNMTTVAVTTFAGSSSELRYQIASRIGLRKGAHEVRVAIEDPATHKRGSVYTYVDVPDFRRDDLSLSGIMVGAAPTSPLTPESIFSDLLPIIPTAEREFTTSSTVVSFVRAYQGGNAPPVDVRMTATLVGATNQPIIHETTTLTAARFSANRSADYFVQLPVEMLTPGPYLLTLEATLDTTTVKRNLRFEMTSKY